MNLLVLLKGRVLSSGFSARFSRMSLYLQGYCGGAKVGARMAGCPRDGTYLWANLIMALSDASPFVVHIT